jgi:uncharacterized membrane protein YjjP (DUF1212 family)
VKKTFASPAVPERPPISTRVRRGFALLWRACSRSFPINCAIAQRLRSLDGRLVTLMRPIGPVGLNLIRASEAATLSERVAKGEVDAATFAAEMERIRRLPFPHNRWVLALAAACAGAAFSKTMAGDNGALALCAVAAGIGQLARSQLQA